MATCAGSFPPDDRRRGRSGARSEGGLVALEDLVSPASEFSRTRVGTHAYARAREVAKETHEIHETPETEEDPPEETTRREQPAMRTRIVGSGS
jgi:hypothetical protein